MTKPSINQLYANFRAGKLNRRTFIEVATAAGGSAVTAAFLANGGDVFAAQSTPAGSPEASPAAGSGVRPTFGTENQKRGQGDQLRILWWQAPTTLAPHSGGDSAAAVIFEPLLDYFPDGAIHPVLLQETPSVENGGLAPDLSSATLKFLPGLLWSDGQPVKAADLVFTWQWVVNPDNASTSFDVWNTIAKIEAVDEVTAKVTYKQPRVNWFEPFVGNTLGIVYPAHAFNNDPKNKNDAFQTAPIATGPYKVDTFSPNDQATFAINEHYREANKPFFSSVLFKGGGDAVSAGRAVVQTGEFDFAWNVQAEPAVIAQLQKDGKKGKIVQTRGTTLESIYINFSDPNKEVDGQKSQKDTPHPFLTDPAVRQAINLSIERDLIANEFYGDGKLATANILTGVAFFESPNTSWSFDLDKAAQTLEDAGWKLNGKTREKDGVKLELTYATSVNQVRQKTQAVVKKDLESIGFKVELAQIDSTIFFDASADNSQNLNHFYWDIAMWSSGSSSLIPINWVNTWYAGPNGDNISQKENGWAKPNVQRYNNPDYDKTFTDLIAVKDNETASKLLIHLNDILIGDAAVVPIAIRSFYTALNNRLRYENLDFEYTFVDYFWNLANWNLADGQ